MCRKPYCSLSSILALLLLCPSCGETNNDVGTTRHSGGAGGSSGSGGVSGNGGVSGSGGVFGTGGAGGSGGAGEISGRGGASGSTGSSGSGGVGTGSGGNDGAAGSPIDAPLGAGVDGDGSEDGGAGRDGSSVDGNDSGLTGVDAAQFCSYNGRTYHVGTTFRDIDGCNECWCLAYGGQAVLGCSLVACSPDAGWPNYFKASACFECASDELCVAYYDGTCKAMQTTCRVVSAATRQSILVNHESCFAKPIGDEICGTQNGQHFWGCGEPHCPSEPLLSDINCYGP